MPLTDAHWLTLSAVADRIVPADEWPSASEAGVLDFLRFLIPAEDLEEAYAAGLEGIDAEARAVHGLPFDALGEETQNSLLESVERGEVRTDWRIAPAAFFTRMAAQVVEGYYANPENGGNRNGVAWEMVGFRVTA